jgi:hypothetical protein
MMKIKKYLIQTVALAGLWMGPGLYAASVVLTLSGRINSIDPTGTQAPPGGLGARWSVEISYPQDTPIPEPDEIAGENVSIQVLQT